MARVTLSITEEERQALVALARAELRDPRAQGSLILRQALEKSGYLPKPTSFRASLAPVNVTKAGIQR